MTPQIRLQRNQLADLQAIRDIGPELLRATIDRLKNLPPVPAPPSELDQTLKAVLANREAAGEALLRQMLSLHGMASRVDLSSNEVFAGLRFGLDPAESGWTKEQFEQWQRLEPLLQELFDLDVLRISAKALDLSYEHAELLQRARILTDIRPVFDAKANEIRGAVISHSLFLRYDDTEGDHILSLAVDQRDIQSLREQCERALKKSETVQAYLKKQPGIAVWVPGKDDNGTT